MIDQESAPRLPVATLLGLKISPRGPSYTLVRLLEGMRSPDMPVSLYAPVNGWPDPLPMEVRTGISGGLAQHLHLPYRLTSKTLKRRSERRLLRHFDATDRRGLVYTWGEVALETSKQLAERRIPVVREKFNCAKQLSRRVLQDAYAQFGIETAIITEAALEKEALELSLADAIFCPSPMVTRSLVDLGIARDKLLDTSYGWEPERFAAQAAQSPRPAKGRPALLFVGHVCVRKGAHLLLEAWRRSGIKGSLTLVGGMETLIQEQYADVLARDDVHYVPYTPDIASFYRSADWFIFPTLEEGGPQVTYEAAGNGLPLLVSPMGAGAFARDGVDGVVLDSSEVDPWVDLLRSLPDREAQREQFGRNAQEHASNFTYDKVGARRRELLLSKFQ
jgi:glycosyltransferase involved in cell wall biosynthesis